MQDWLLVALACQQQDFLVSGKAAEATTRYSELLPTNHPHELLLVCTLMAYIAAAVGEASTQLRAAVHVEH